MQRRNAATALAYGQQQMQNPVDVGACGANPNAGFGYPPAGALGYPSTGGYGLGYPPGPPFAPCSPGYINPGFAPMFNSFVPPGVVFSSKTLGACGVLGADGTIYEIVGHEFIGDLEMAVNGVLVEEGGFNQFVPILRRVGTGGVLRITIDDGFANIIAWKWMHTTGILINEAKAENDFVNKVINTPADAFNVDGCACPIAFVCITEDDSLDLTLSVNCDGPEEPFVALIEGETPPIVDEVQADAFGLHAKLFSFALYLNVYETVGTCGVVAPIYPIAPCNIPAFPAPPYGPCPPLGPGPGNGFPPNGPTGGGFPGGGYMGPTGQYM